MLGADNIKTGVLIAASMAGTELSMSSRNDYWPGSGVVIWSLSYFYGRLISRHISIRASQNSSAFAALFKMRISPPLYMTLKIIVAISIGALPAWKSMNTLNVSPSLNATIISISLGGIAGSNLGYLTLITPELVKKWCTAAPMHNQATQGVEGKYQNVTAIELTSEDEELI